jgi:hypothetical protein
MPRPDVFDLMRRSLETLAAEAPQTYAALREAVGPLRARFSTAGRARLFRTTASGFALEETTEASDVDIGFDRAVVLDLAEARLTLEEALIADRLHAKGSVAAVARLHDALNLYLEGLLRAPGAAALYEDYCET